MSKIIIIIIRGAKNARKWGRQKKKVVNGWRQQEKFARKVFIYFF